MSSAASVCWRAASLAGAALAARPRPHVRTVPAISGAGGPHWATSRSGRAAHEAGLARRNCRRAGATPVRARAYRTVGHGGTSFDEEYGSLANDVVNEQCTPWATGPCTDEFYMGLALEEAIHAGDANEVPVGAVLVHDGSVVARAHNQVEGLEDPTAHAEMLCIRQGADALGSWQSLKDCTIYVTLEPCPMCAGALLQARVGTIVYGAPSPLLGADGGWIHMLRGHHSHGDTEQWGGEDGVGGFQPRDDEGKPRPRGPHPFHPDVLVKRGVLAEESSRLMRAFFRWRRGGQGADGHVPAWREFYEGSL